MNLIASGVFDEFQFKVIYQFKKKTLSIIFVLHRKTSEERVNWSASKHRLKSTIGRLTCRSEYISRLSTYSYI